MAENTETEVKKLYVVRTEGLYADYKPNGIHQNTIYFATDKKKIYYNNTDYTDFIVDETTLSEDIKNKLDAIDNKVDLSYVEKYMYTSEQVDKKLEDYYTSNEVNDAITSATTGLLSANDVDTKLSDYAKKTDVDTTISNKIDELNLSQFAKITDVNTKLSDYAKTTDVESVITDKIDELNLSQFAKITDVNTKLSDYAKTTDVESKIETAVRDLVSETDLNTKLNDYITSDEIDEKLTEIDDKIENAVDGLISETNVDNKLKGYYTSTVIDTKFADYIKTTDVESKIETAVDGLISETAVDTKLANLKADILGEDISEAFDTLKEFQTWAEEHGTEYNALFKTVTSLIERVVNIENALEP